MLKVSIIISCYNSAGSIRKSVESALFQTYQNVEVVVVNDASTDNSLEVLNTINDDRLHIFSHGENMGAGHARKTGIAKSTGDFIFFLDSDDYIDEDFIEKMMSLTEENSDIDIVCSGAYFEYPDGTVNECKYEDYCCFSIEEKFTFYSKEWVYLNGRLIRKKLFEKVPYSTMPYFEDVDTYIPLLIASNGIISTSHIGYHYMMNPKSLTHTATAAKNMVFSTLIKIKRYDAFVHYGLIPKKEIYKIMYDYMNHWACYHDEILSQYGEWHNKILAYSKTLPHSL